MDVLSFLLAVKQFKEKFIQKNEFQFDSVEKLDQTENQAKHVEIFRWTH